MATPESGWRLPKLSVDLDGDWFDDGVEVTHPGVLTNLRSGLKRDAQGYFIQTRVRIPVEVADALGEDRKKLIGVVRWQEVFQECSRATLGG